MMGTTSDPAMRGCGTMGTGPAGRQAVGCAGRYRGLPSMAVRMIKLGEETGQLPMLADGSRSSSRRSSAQPGSGGRRCRSGCHHLDQHRGRRLDRIGDDLTAVRHPDCRIRGRGTWSDCNSSGMRTSVPFPQTKQRAGVHVGRNAGGARHHRPHYGLVGPRVVNYLTKMKAKAAKIQIESLGSALDLFYLESDAIRRARKAFPR